MYRRMSRQQQKLFIFSLILLLLVSSLIFTAVYLGRYPTTQELIALGKAVILPQKTATLAVEGQEYEFPLPPNTAFLTETAQYQKYLTLTRGEKLQKYFIAVLPQHGWVYVEQLGSGYIFSGDGVRLTCTRRGLVRGIEILTYSLHPAP